MPTVVPVRGRQGAGPCPTVVFSWAAARGGALALRAVFHGRRQGTGGRGRGPCPTVGFSWAAARDGRQGTGPLPYGRFFMGGGGRRDGALALRSFSHVRRQGAGGRGRGPCPTIVFPCAAARGGAPAPRSGGLFVGRAEVSRQLRARNPGATLVKLPERWTLFAAIYSKGGYQYAQRHSEHAPHALHSLHRAGYSGRDALLVSRACSAARSAGQGARTVIRSPLWGWVKVVAAQ